VYVYCKIIIIMIITIIILCYGAHSARLRDAVAALACRLANTIMSWDDICALVSNHLIALNKCPGVQPMARPCVVF